MSKQSISPHWSIVCCLMFLLPCFLGAQPKLSASESSYQRARRVVEDGIKALGGAAAIADLKSFTLIERRKGYDAFQNPVPGPPYVSYEATETLRVDLEKSRLWHDAATLYPRFAYGTLTIINDKLSYRADLWSQTATQLNTPSLDNYRSLFQKLPQFFLLDVLTERAASLRWLGAGEVEGHRHEIVTFIDRSNRQLALYFDAQTKLLTKYEYLYLDPAIGDTQSEFVFKGYRDVGQFKVPTEMINRTGNQAQHESHYEVQLNPSFDEAAFALPAKYQVITPGPARNVAPDTMIQIAKDVYLVENIGNSSYNVLVVAFDDFILVSEAPETRPHSGLSERVIARIKETLPNKPIRYVTFSHHHIDHGNGLRAYIAEGATVITTPGNKQFVESVAAAKFTLKPDVLARAARQPQLEIIANKKHVISDAHHIVELYDVGPYWHANEEVLVYLPQEKLLFEGDLFTSGFGEDVGPAQDHPILLAEKIKELGLDAQQIAGVHGRLRPIADLYKAIERRRLKDSQTSLPRQTSNSTTREYCANIGPVSLTFDGAMVTGRYRITVSPKPIDGTIKGSVEEGLLDATWTDSDGTGRIIFGFVSDLSKFGAFFNTLKNPNHWFDGWRGIEKSKLSEASAEQQRSLRCDWK